MLAKIEDFAPQEETGLKMHCFDPWLILKSRTNQEAKAKRALEREHFEVYYGERREIVQVTIPARKISSKTRYRRRSETRTIERVRPIYPGYLFARRLFGFFDLFAAYELEGVTGLCMIGAHPATVPDYMIELLRFEEARGGIWKLYDDGEHEYVEQRPSYSRAPRDIQAAERQRRDEEKRREAEKLIGAQIEEKTAPKCIGRLDRPNGSIVFLEELGRITRIITAPDLPKMSADPG